MRAIVLMFDSLNRHMLPAYGDTVVDAPNFARLAERAVTFDNFYAGSMPCMPARREMHTGRYNFLHRSWGPLEPFDDSMPEMLGSAGVHTHLASDHPHYWEDGGATYHTRYSTWEFFRGQEGDPWKGVVGSTDPAAPVHARMVAQDAVNRRHMPTEAEHSQTLTVDAGIEFLDTNAGADRWMLQLELFDPHEPFFVHDAYRRRYGDAPEQPFDWPGYRKVTESTDMVAEARSEYAALVSMCDHSLGRVLDAMDRHDMWRDTMLIVNTDHGFLLGEHGWWAKSVQPWFNELVHLPMFLWDPRTAGADERRGDLAQTIDIAPTLLGFFGVDATPDMQGRDLAHPEAAPRERALFGIHGGHINVTDGRYVYMRASAECAGGPLEEYTLMPTHMRARFAPDELAAWEPAPPRAFTKGLRTMRMPARAGWLNSWSHGTLLFDLENDPHQTAPLDDETVEARMAQLLVEEMRASDAPDSQFVRLGLPRTGAIGSEHLRVRADRARAAALAEPLPHAADVPQSDLLAAPLVELARVATQRRAIEGVAPDLFRTEALTLPPSMSVWDLAAMGALTADQLLQIGRALDAAVASTA
ncbi:sulfatase [Microbacterium excoecariae]|uniref:sulfatase n=1 Tax=Microbacterium excoecariae TaxID=2715210 RepID=UPI00140888C3|nr:sulfatase [Microbacterium excoecariae]NHI16714.1 sulfatase [Microbacterium excoecariae]